VHLRRGHGARSVLVRHVRVRVSPGGGPVAARRVSVERQRLPGRRARPARAAEDVVFPRPGLAADAEAVRKQGEARSRSVVLCRAPWQTWHVPVLVCVQFEAAWPKKHWDHWIRNNKALKGLHVVIPEV
jgi:hypothetical protein